MVVCMGDLQVWPQPNGILTEESAPSANPHPSAIDANRWAKAELRTSEIILCIQPTKQSEKKRNEVIEYVQRLLRMRGLEVFAFGSVPLKTYLPDGDVDLTTISNYQNNEDKWANDVRVVLEGEKHNKLAEFRVKEVQYVDARVKLVQCLGENIKVDISFNQLGGLGTLCFLEKVDQLIGKDHLFKRSIILVKAWCYYESRILGAHHGLISTYALETLVLYIFHLFHASLHGPLEVLYRFLDYFSKFDWDNYCLSLQGPVSIKPDNNAEPPKTDGGDRLVSKKFLKECTDRFSFPPKGHDNQNRSLTFKNLNIIDPLQENDNLGRSVNKGNFYRIRYAFTYGAQNLGQILLSSEEKIGEELDKFFLNTVERHRNGHRQDVSDSIFCSVKSRLVGETIGFQQSSNSDVKEKFDKNAVDINEALSVTQPSSGAGCSVPNMDQNLKWHGRTTPFSGVSCFEGSNTPSCGTVTCSGMIPVGSVLDALRHLKADLDGDFDSHSSNLEYAKLCQESGSHGSGPPNPSLYMQEQFIQEGPARQFNLNTNVYPYMHGYRVGQLFPPGYIGGANRVILPGSFSGEELSKPRNGIGTFIPNMSLGSYKERYFNRGRNQGAPAQDFTPRVGNQMHRPRSNGRNKMNFDQNFQRQIGNKSIDLNSAGVRSGDRDGDISRLGKISYQLVNNTVSEQTLGPMAPEVYSVSNMAGHGKLINSVRDKLCNSPVSTMQPYSNGSDFHNEQLEFGSFGPVQLGALSPGVKSEQRCMNSDELNGQWVNSEVLPASSGGTILEKSGAPLDYKREASWKEGRSIGPGVMSKL